MDEAACREALAFLEPSLRRLSLQLAVFEERLVTPAFLLGAPAATVELARAQRDVYQLQVEETTARLRDLRRADALRRRECAAACTPAAETAPLPETLASTLRSAGT